MIAEAQKVIANTLEKSQYNNLEYARHLREFGDHFIRKAKDRKLSGEATDNALEAFFTRLMGGNTSSVRRRMWENEMKGKDGILVPRDHDTLYIVIRGILRERGW